ncbi:MAG: hypothetical protein AAF310_06230, partial [Myxococcota bacterium]
MKPRKWIAGTFTALQLTALPNLAATPEPTQNKTDIANQIGYITTMALSPDGNYLVSGGQHQQQGIVKVWDLKKANGNRQLHKSPAPEYNGHKHLVTSTAINHQRLIAAADSIGTINLWNAKDGYNWLILTQTLEAHDSAVNTLAF